MKLRIISDLHLDCGAMRARPGIGADAAIVAGDTVNGRNTLEIPGLLEHLFPEQRIFAIVGNHEGYRLADFESMVSGIKKACEGTRVTLLHRDAVDYMGIRFLGATLWTDFELFGSKYRDDGMAAAMSCMMDYRVIGQNGQVITADDTLEWHRRDLAWIRAEITRAAKESVPCVAITHHAPSRASLAKKYAADLSSAGFVSDLPLSDFAVPKLWVHGHTHTSFHHSVGDCQVVCNPRGYTQDLDISTENPAFNPDFLLELL